MEFYLFILIVLFVTAIADLTVGVANDAVNFLNSAVGSKAGRRATILIVASLGVLVGTTFSGGIMEVARKGIFNPEAFVFHEVMILFLAVMMTDIIMLDLFNTFGLPTSTTVSLVFELIGASVAIAGVKVVTSGAPILEVVDYLNAGNVLAIISGIGLSIVVAFFFGTIVQFLTRLTFTFKFEQRFRRYGALWCALALTAITYFILVKGAKGSTLLTPATAAWIQENTVMLLGASLLFWTVLLQLVIAFTRVPVLRLIVLIGTFALALSFASNDLVNFIGAPVAALSAFQIAAAQPGLDPFGLTMGGLAGAVPVNTWILLFAGAVMAVTLWVSRKARSVTRTEVSLGRQEEGFERFGASPLSRGIVRMALAIFGAFKSLVPQSVRSWIAARLNPADFVPLRTPEGEVQSFDYLRAAVNLMVGSAVISLGTALKLPLSTTFVTFMVAMSTSMVDGSWGRESAVYRVGGVITVIAGWFFTAFVAFITAATFALGLFFGGLIGVIAIVALGAIVFWRTSMIHREREAEEVRHEASPAEAHEADARASLRRDVAALLSDARSMMDNVFEGLTRDRRKPLRESRKEAQRLSKEIDKIVAGVFRLIRLAGDETAMGSHYAQQIAALQILGANLNAMAESGFTHVDNNHHPPDKAQASELADVFERSNRILKRSVEMLRKGEWDHMEWIRGQLAELKETVLQYDRNQMKRVKLGKSGTRNSLLFLGTMSKAERVVAQSVQFVELCQTVQNEQQEA